MKPLENEIKNRYENMHTMEDFLDVINFIRQDLYPNSKFPITAYHLAKYTHTNEKYYTKFEIQKKSGQARVIHTPKSNLKQLQRCINYFLQAIFKPHHASFGFVSSRSIKDNAGLHQHKNYVYNTDLKDFFCSIDVDKVAWNLEKIMQLSSQDHKAIIHAISSICTTAIDALPKPALPQGAPTSPTLSNIACQDLDQKLYALSEQYNICYSRYADDITFSSMHNMYTASSSFLNEVQAIISSQNFTIQTSKTRLQKRGHRQEVTGLVVNDIVNVKSKYIKQLRTWLYLWERHGYQKANKIYSYKKSLENTYLHVPELSNVIYGKLQYLKMIVGKENNLYNTLIKRYNTLTKKVNQ